VLIETRRGRSGIAACYDIRTAAPGADVQLSFFREEFPKASHYPGGGSYGGFETCRGTTFRSAPGRYYFKVTSNQPQGYMVRLYGGRVRGGKLT
jgi:hypothetical protein